MCLARQKIRLSEAVHEHDDGVSNGLKIQIISLSGHRTKATLQHSGEATVLGR